MHHRGKAIVIALCVLVSIAILLAVGSVEEAEETPTTESPATDAPATRLIKDFGEVINDGKGRPLIATFDVANTTSSSTRVEISHKGCGCLSVELPDEIPAGASRDVDCQLEIGGRLGPFRTTVDLSLISEDGAVVGKLTLEMAYIAVPAMRVSPPSIVHRNCPPGKPVQSTVEVITIASRATQDDEFQIPEMTCSDPSVQVSHVDSEEMELENPTVPRVRHTFNVFVTGSADSVGESLETNVLFTGAEGETAVLPIHVEYASHRFVETPTRVVIPE